MYKWEYTIELKAAGNSKQKKITCLLYSENIDSEFTTNKKDEMKTLESKILKNYSFFSDVLLNKENVFRTDMKTNEKIDMGKMEITAI